MEELKKDLRDDQKNRDWTYYKSCTNSKMRTKAGHVFIANAIWEIGLPHLPPFATEQRQLAQLSAQELEDVPEAIQSVLNWLDRIA